MFDLTPFKVVFLWLFIHQWFIVAYSTCRLSYPINPTSYFPNFAPTTMWPTSKHILCGAVYRRYIQKRPQWTGFLFWNGYVLFSPYRFTQRSFVRKSSLLFFNCSCNPYRAFHSLLPIADYRINANWATGKRACHNLCTYLMLLKVCLYTRG